VSVQSEGRFSEYSVLKRGIDLLGGVTLAISLLPVVMIVALLIWFDDGTPVLYTQTRAGRRHKPFRIYKFRTMKRNTPSISTEEMKKLGIDPITHVGRFLRRSSLDELPQIWNVIIGDMSFIGPRPALLTQDPVLTARAASGVDALLPGITGLAQVRGRDDLNDDEKVKLDAEYLDKFSLEQDVQILFETFSAVFTGRGNA
jgi:lipopolysaccharide/colanic/teichoic acid biosynthesis glycosyltransferase